MLLIRLLACVVIFSAVLFSYLDQHNAITRLRYELPQMHDAFTVAQERSAALDYEVERFESPLHLMHLLKQPEYGHLQHPQLTDIIWIDGQTD